MKNLLVAQSGGPTAVINSSLAGVISAGFAATDKIEKVLGGLCGIEGIENDRIVSLDGFRDAEKLRVLKQTPSSYLGSCRRKLPEPAEDRATFENIFSIFEKHNIGYFFYIGGNDSMDTVDKLSRYAEENGYDIRVAGIPKTIDNDLAVTDHTPGYGSAAKFVANSMRQLALDTGVYEMPSAVVLEIMGRNAGWLTAAAALGNVGGVCAADIICLPETPFDSERFLAEVERVSRVKKTIMIAVSEGIRGEDGKYITEGSAGSRRGDKFAHAALGGVGKTLETQISEKLGIKTRSIELSTLQRCQAASASLCDVNEAFEAGLAGVRFALEGKSGFVPAFRRISSKPYKTEIFPLEIACAANLEKKLPQSMIREDGFGVTEEFLEYASPLISGEPSLLYENGVLRLATAE